MNIEEPYARSTRKTWLILLGVGGGLLLLCGLGCGGAFFWLMRSTLTDLPAVQASATAFLDDLQAGRIDNAYQSTTADHQARRSRAQFEAWVSQYPALQGHTSRTVGRLHVHQQMTGKTAVYQVTVLGGNNTLSFTLHLREEQGWKVHDLTIP